MVIAFKYMKDMIKAVLNSSIMGLLDSDREYDLNQYYTYKKLMSRKSNACMENIDRYQLNDEIQSQYLSLDADTVL
jgi:hypothetical protein